MRLDAGGESQLASLNWIMIAYSVITWMSGMTSAAILERHESPGSTFHQYSWSLAPPAGAGLDLP
jgi:hypothetical protein